MGKNRKKKLTKIKAKASIIFFQNESNTVFGQKILSLFERKILVFVLSRCFKIFFRKSEMSDIFVVYYTQCDNVAEFNEVSNTAFITHVSLV